MIAYFRDIILGFKSILLSMVVTLRHLFSPAVTFQYPDQRRKMPLRALNKHVLTIDLNTGKLKCTACDACAKICPTRCIEIHATGKGKNRYPEKFWIDHNLCMYCNLCVEVCPFDAITMWTGKYEFGSFQRTGLVIDKEEMTASGFYPTPMTPEAAPAGAAKAGR